MAINFTGMNTTTVTGSDSADNPVQAPPAPAGVTLDLGKNVILDLTKTEPGLVKILVGAGWNVATAGSSIDLDLIAVMRGSNGKIRSAADIIYFKKPEASGIKLGPDNTTGEGEGDDETIEINLPAIDPEIQSIVFAVVIFDAVNKRQTFGMVKNSYVRVVNDENDNELCHFFLKDEYSTDTAVIFAELTRESGDWQFRTIGEGKQADINGIASLYC